MDGGGIASRFLNGSIAFTGIVVILIVFITLLSYLSGGLGASTRRTYTFLGIVLFLAGVAAIAMIFFPNVVRDLYNYLNRLGYQ
jgi:hypothetical protein